jgi:hypothetical protein
MADLLDNDVEFELLDVESEILCAANTLAAKRNRGSFSDYLLAPERLSSFSADKRLHLLQKHLQRLKTQLSEIASAPQLSETQLSEIASAPPPASIRAPHSQDSTLLDRLPSSPDSTLQDRNGSPSVARAKSLDRSSDRAELSLVTERGPLLPLDDPSIPPPPPTKKMKNTSCEGHLTVWKYLVSAYKHPHESFLTRRGEVKKIAVLRQCERDTGITVTRVGHFLHGHLQKFTWDQAVSAANQGPFAEQQIHRLNCKSREYRDIVRPGGKDGRNADGDEHDSGSDAYDPDASAAEAAAAAAATAAEAAAAAAATAEAAEGSEGGAAETAEGSEGGAAAGSGHGN